ncbi:MAG: sigma 54-interacting transcriptional regulator [Pseudomonadota bacterium]
MSKEALLCWVGQADLDASTGAKEGSGPILATMRERPHRRLHLLYNYPKAKVDVYCEWLTSQASAEVRLHEVRLSSPVHYGDIYREASRTLGDLIKEVGKEQVSVLVSPGTAQMHSVWILMCKTTFEVEMLESSEQQGIGDVRVPFDIAADFIPTLLAESDATLRRMAAGDAATAPAFENIIAQSGAMLEQIAKARLIAERDIPALILGESGTGKELFARAIHNASPRGRANKGPLKVVNCGAISPELVDSELFGHAKGAFTGATQKKEGYFEAADGGTIFLDEFGELPLDTQVRLLRVLNDGTFTPVGDTVERKVDVRIIAATNRDLMSEIVEGKFREDLFYRVAVGVVTLPPLRQREGDLMLLTDRLMEGINKEEIDRGADREHKKLSVKARNVIKAHSWPGNVRELQASLTRASVFALGRLITEQEMREAILQRPAKAGDLLSHEFNDSFDIQELIRSLKRHYLKKALAQTGDNKTKAADKLGLKSYQTLTKWMEDVGL